MSNYIVFDLEWNQGSAKTERTDIPFEIIEIGAVKLNKDKEVIDSFESLICPSVYSRMFYMTARVTNITMDELRQADRFPEVFARFSRWCGDDFIFCTWGNMDLLELRRNLAYHGMESINRGAVSYLDIQKLYSLELDDGKSRRALEKAVDDLDIEKNDSFHRADSDAYYTAEIFRRLKKRELEVYESFDVFRLPPSKETEVNVSFPTYSKYISRGFRSKTDVLHDKEATSLRCFCCGEKTSKHIPWVSVNGKQYFAMGKCSEHGMMRGHLRIRKNWDGAVYAMKTIRPAKAGDESALRLKEKLAKEQEKKIRNMLRNSQRNAQKSKSSNSEK